MKKKPFNFNFKYAIQEIVSIFIGITLAIYFNNWNQYRSDRAAEQENLITLKHEFEENFGRIDKRIKT